MRTLVIGAVLALVFAGAVGRASAGAGAPPAPKRVAEPLQSICPDVPLGDAAHTVWSSGSEMADIVARLKAARIAVLGEIHDNAHHHRLQACLLAAFAEKRRPAVVWEQFNETQSDALSRYWSRPDRTADGLGAALGWAKTGWPAWAIYRPIAEVAARRDLPMLAGNVSRTKVMGVARGGLETLEADDINALGLAEPLPDAEEKALRDVLVASHCGLMPASAFGPMALAQNLRDAWMARAVLRARAEHGAAVLVTGNGHVHRFRGVPLYLARQDRTQRSNAVVTVMIVETQTPESWPADAVARGAGANASAWAADIVIATRPAEREDPCIAMRKRFGGQRPAK